MDVVVAEKLTKEFNGRAAVRGIDFAVRARECFGFLGPNGAGKTTTVNMICCFSPVTSGRLTVLGMDVRKHPRQIKSRLGVVPQENNLDPDLKVLQNLLVYAGYFRLPAADARPRAMELLEFFDLADRAGERVDRLSGGMKRRLTIARALINNPEVVVLDEPTTGLDPQARHLVWQRLRRLKERGVTLLLTTHYLEEASQLCDRLVIMDQGEILEEGDPRGLVSRHIGREVVEVGLPGGYAQIANTPCAGQPEGRFGTGVPGKDDRPEQRGVTLPDFGGPDPAGGGTGKVDPPEPAGTALYRLKEYGPPGSLPGTAEWGIEPENGIKMILHRVDSLIRGHLVVGDNIFLFPRDSGQAVLQALQSLPVPFAHLLLRPATLEDVFLKLTGRGLDG
ncbi:ABC transporter ATP-binding protein [Desulfofundulus thermobenzoicus]|uniref:ABC transporter ATP-binding protein n=1 Tax=Desulfofundulus thermobenzoicus TaxID=29376 RepID=UPI00311AB617